jgi:ABC-type molybdate transport system substrate-binding protein
MELVVRAGNPKKIQDLKSLSTPSDLRIGLCVPAQPCGIGAQNLFKFAQLNAPGTPVLAPDSKTNIDSVASGQIDVALVYRSEYAAHPAPGLREVALDPPADGRIDYEIRRGKKNAASSLFMSYIASTDGANRLKSIGLLAS